MPVNYVPWILRVCMVSRTISVQGTDASWDVQTRHRIGGHSKPTENSLYINKNLPTKI